MTRSRFTFLSILAAVLILLFWLWWMRPRSIDMASYAPVDSLLYIESNSPAAVADALNSTDAWKIVTELDNKSRVNANPWVEEFVRWTGIGPVNSAVLVRSQVAVVVTDLGVTEEGDTLTIKPEVAIVIETNTSATRIKGPTERELQRFAEKIYGATSVRRTTIDGNEFLEWVAPEGSRHIVATVNGSVVIVGNTQRSVQRILAVKLHQQPSLVTDNELRQLRESLEATRALAFGFVPSKSSPHLLSVMVPMILGRAPNNSELGRLIDSSAAKIIGSVGWSCRSFKGGVEDRYLIGINPAAMSQFRDSVAVESSEVPMRFGEGITSASYYRFKNPAHTWLALRTAVSSRVDAVSAILFSSLLKSALLSYGISEPEKFLNLVANPVVTVRVEGSANALLIAKTTDELAMRELLTTMGYRSATPVGQPQSFSNPESELSARVSNGTIMIGTAEDIDKYLKLMNRSATNSGSVETASSDACVVSYADDSNRVRAFILTLKIARSLPAQLSASQEAMITSLPYATTETILQDAAIVRTTRSPLGQFSTLLPLIFPEKPSASPQR